VIIRLYSIFENKGRQQKNLVLTMHMQTSLWDSFVQKYSLVLTGSNVKYYITSTKVKGRCEQSCCSKGK